MRIVFRCDPALIDRIPRPIPARRALPDWLREMPASAFSDAHFPRRGQDRAGARQLNTLTPASLYEAFPAAEASGLVERFEGSYTPRHGS